MRHNDYPTTLLMEPAANDEPSRYRMTPAASTVRRQNSEPTSHFCSGFAAGTALLGLLVLAFLPSKACAQERYTDPDKVMHIGAGLVIGAGVTAYTKSATAGALAGCAVGIAKEAYDASQPARHSATEAVLNP